MMEEVFRRYLREHNLQQSRKQRISEHYGLQSYPSELTKDKNKKKEILYGTTR